ncbi:Fructose-2,6-bisphosphatase TIGAR [Trichinella sp. T9]|nr:Fructose-2,6-bisphosphatase TIGAR [Trichinella sp. T9]
MNIRFISPNSCNSSGLTDLNVHHVVQGHLNCSLNEEGREQAVSLGRHFTAVGTTLSLVYSSDLLRAVETAELIISCQKFAKDLQIVPDPRLRERNYGRFDGQPFANLMEASRARNVKPEHFDGEGVEPLPLFDARVREWFESMCEATLVNYDKTVEEEPNFRPTILVVSHGGTIRRLFAHCFSPELMMSGSFCPGSRGAAMRIAANTAYSTFDLHLNLDVSDRGLQCLRLHLVSCSLFYWKLQFQTLLISCPASGKCSFLWHCVEIDAFSPTVSYCTSWSFRKKMATRRGEAKFSITKLIESASLENTPVVGRQSVAFLLKLFPNCKNSQALSTEAAV